MTTAIGMFDNINHVETAVKQLHDAGIEKDAISMLATGITGNQTAHGLAHVASKSEHETIMTGLFTLLIGSALIWIPRDGPVVSLGPIAADMGGTPTKSAASVITDALAGRGIPQPAASTYCEQIKQGRYLVVVPVDAETAAITTQVLDDNGATTVACH